MAQPDQELIGSVIRSIDKKIAWEPMTPKDDNVRLSLKTRRGQTILEVPQSDVDAAHEDDSARNRLRERIKKARKRISDARPTYMPWVLPKIEPIGAPGPRGGWGGGRR